MIGPASVRRTVLAVVAVCALVGIVQGVAWAFTAPGIPYKVLTDGRYGALPTTSTYRFVDVALFSLSGMVVGILLAVGVWQVRSARGWQTFLALVGGSLGGALLAWAAGASLAPGTDPASVGASAAETIVIAPPTTGTVLVVLAQPALAAAIYTFLVAWNGRPDLGSGAAPAVPEAAGPVLPTAQDPLTEPSSEMDGQLPLGSEPPPGHVPAATPERIAP